MQEREYLAQAESLFQTERWDELIGLFGGVPLSEIESIPTVQKNRLLFWVATAYTRKVKLPNAWPLVEKLLEAEPEDLGVLHLAALVTSGMGEYERAADFATRYLDAVSSGKFSQKFGVSENQKYEIYHTWGVALKHLGEAEKAEEAFRKALEINESELTAHLDLTYLLFQKKKYAEAGMALTEALKKCEETEELLQLAEAYCAVTPIAPVYFKALSEAGHWPELLKSLNKNTDFSNATWAKKFKAQALAGLGNWLEAKVCYEEYLSVAADDWEALNELGNTCFQLGLYDQAEAAYRQALQANPAWEEGWRNLSSSLSKLGKYEEARTSLELYVSRVPQDKSAYGLLADLLYQKKEFGRAINFYEDFLRFHPAEKEYWVRLADCYFNLGHPQSALQFYHRAQDLEPGSKEIQARIELVSRQFPPAE